MADQQNKAAALMSYHIGLDFKLYLSLLQHFGDISSLKNKSHVPENYFFIGKSSHSANQNYEVAT